MTKSPAIDKLLAHILAELIFDEQNIYLRNTPTFTEISTDGDNSTCITFELRPDLVSGSSSEASALSFSTDLAACLSL